MASAWNRDLHRCITHPNGLWISRAQANFVTVNYLLIALFCGFLAANEELAPKPAAKAPRKEKKAIVENPAGKVDPVEHEYEKLLELDEAALKEVEKLQNDAASFSAKGAAEARAVLAGKIQARLDPVKKAYGTFLQKNPKHVDALLAYGSFLNEIGDEEEAINQWEKARRLDLKNPAAWNNLANVFGHIGPIKKAFQYYEKAIELDPTEPVYLQNLATTTYLFRKDAAETYRIDEQAVFNKALELYQRAMKLDPTNLVLATDYAQSFYGIRPMRVEEAITAWNHALGLANTDTEKQGVYIHLARVELNSGRFLEAQRHLELIHDADMLELKNRLQKNLDRKKSETGGDSTEKKESSAKLTKSP
jgi:tetratricopeptide (TPR) repeat protein